MDRDTTRRTAVEQFEKNRFFEGKLMTARDMEVEQRYHARRLRTLARHTTGTGIVRGLAVEGVESVDSGLEVTVAPGLALDGLGRPIVVDSRTTKTVPEPSGQTVYLALRQAEMDGESVPVPGDDQRTNRAIEGFEVTYRESPPSTDQPLPDLPLAGEVAADSKALAAGLDTSDDADPSVFVGAYERTERGWQPLGTGPSRSRVYSNDALFELLSAHIADDGNPHQVDAEVDAAGPPASALDDSQAILRQLDDLRETVATLQARQEPMVRYVRGRSLADTVQQFDDVAERFVGHDDAATRRAKAVASAAETALDTTHEDGESPQKRLDAVAEAEEDFGEALSGAATQATRERYVEAVSALRRTLDGDPTALEAAVAQDLVVAAADRLSVLYDVVPEA